MSLQKKKKVPPKSGDSGYDASLLGDEVAPKSGDSGYDCPLLEDEGIPGEGNEGITDDSEPKPAKSKGDTALSS